MEGDEDFPVLVTEDGGIRKRVVSEGRGERAVLDGSVKVKVVVHMWRTDERGKKHVLYEPSEAVPALKWLLNNSLQRFVAETNEPPKGADRCVQSMLLGEKSVFRLLPKYAYGRDGGSIVIGGSVGERSRRRIPENTVVFMELEVLRMRKPKLKRFEIKNTERKKRAIACRARGKELFAEGKFFDAMMQYRDCSDYSSCVTPTEDRDFVRDVRVPGNLDACVSAMRLERWDDALEFADNALAMDYDNVKGLYLKAKCLERLGSAEKAMEVIIKAVKVDPANAEVRREYERIKEVLGPRADTTKEAFQKVFRAEIYKDEEHRWSSGPSIVAELVFGIVFWSLFATLGAQIWFFPLEYMDITGYEVVVLCIFSPILLVSSAVARLARNRLLHVAAAVGLAVAFKLPTLLPRVLVLSASTFLSLLCIAARWSFTGRWLGLSGAVVALDRLLNLSRPSLWTTPETSFALVFCVGSAWYLGDPSSPPPPSRPFSLLSSVSLGSLLFLVQWLLLQSGAMSRLFAVPVMSGSLLVFAASVLGYSLALPRAPRLRRALAAFPALFMLALLVFPPHALVLAALGFSLAMQWRPCAEYASGRPVGTTLAIAILVWFLHFLASIWTVAYNFVPFGGSLMREQTHVHLVVAALLAGLAGMLRPQMWSAKAQITNRQAFVVGMILLVLFAPVAIIRIRGALAVNVRAAKQARADVGQIRSMIWAVHFGYDNFGRNSFDEIEYVIRKNNVNVIGLLESDLTRPFTDNWDVVDYLSVQLGLYSDFGPSTLNNTWGCALLSTFPIVHVERWMLPSPEGELACIMDAKLHVGGGKHVNVVVTHFGNHRDALDRQLQTEEVAALLKRSNPTTPYLFLGYLTNRPYSDHYNMLTAAGWQDSAPNEMRRWCQYIFYRGLKLEEFRRYDTGDTSDTEAQIAHFRI